MDMMTGSLKRCFPLSQVEAGLQVYGRIMDPQNAHKLMKQVLDKVQLKDLYTRLGSLAIFNPRNPTGYYRLQLSQQTQFTVARRLLEMFQVSSFQDLAVQCLCPLLASLFLFSSTWGTWLSVE